MDKVRLYIKKRLSIFLLFTLLFCGVIIVRLAYIEIFKSGWLQSLAYEQQTRDRLISPLRGRILDRNYVVIADNESANAVSVIHAQIKDEEKTAKYLSDTLGLDYADTLKKVQKKVALVRIKNKVDNQTAQKIRDDDVPGVEVDEDVKRAYPFNELAAQVIGFSGKDNQGVTGLEAKYDKYLAGKPGKILTLTDSAGVALNDEQVREEPENGENLITTLDVTIQQYARQTIKKAVEAKQAKRGIIIVLNPKNGEIYAMVNYPDFNLNEPFKINNDALAAIWNTLSEKEKNTYLNQMWRNTAINDTYEPGSTFKIVTSSAGLQEGVVDLDSKFVCNGYLMVGGRRIKCWRYPRTHGAETFLQGVQNSCNPVFMTVGLRLGAEKFHEYMLKFGFDKKTGIDLPGEAVGIMHKLENMGPVEVATMSFGQGFQITPLQLLRAASAIVNGGYLVTPHIAKYTCDSDGNVLHTFEFKKGEQVISKETSDKMRFVLESVVSDGTGRKAYIPGYRIGGKTATSQKLPRGNGKYIASYMGFAPADNPQVMAIVIIDEPQGVYYGGTVAGPVMKELFENILPYLGIEPKYSEKEQELDEVIKISVPSFEGLKINDAKKLAKENGITYVLNGTGENIVSQFPPEGTEVNKGTTVIFYSE
ncbi:MAG: PASTA domain-containing protein [Clostridia bacterium]|jgi:stage V sporulation protein D (sporulation-specific penicillin-binding protein)|nr:PASTA domain-containing protein [Clostridia bacterium]MCI1999625.1 PASTA domain-containing protein [Clostridia bacterium]MCI2013996.1 PASTA domain-containing protein [Clostridia bacterium]